MKVWLPYVTGGSGMDLFTRSLADGLKSLGCEVTLTNFPHYLQYAPAAMSRAKAPSEVDVVLVNSWNGFAFRRPGAKLVAACQLCVHDPALAPFRSAAQATFHRTLIKYFERRTFSVADAIVVPSVATAMGIQNAFHVEPAVIPNGIDTDFFTPGTTMPDSGGRFRLLFVGNPTKRKGADLLTPLMSRLGSDYVLEYTSGLRDSGVISGPNVLPLGSLDQAAVREAYRRADAFVFPTRLEGLPLTVLEAMACGLPIIGSDRTSMPEAVTDGREGFLRPPEIEPLAAAIEQLRADNETRSKMGRAARERAVREFRTDRMVRDYCDFFRDLCRDGHSRRHALAVSPTHR